jgi:hypothetical protein
MYSSFNFNYIFNFRLGKILQKQTNKKQKGLKQNGKEHTYYYGGRYSGFGYLQPFPVRYAEQPVC